MLPDLQNSVVLITSRQQNSRNFGTGFVIRRSSGAVYILTCAHVVRDVGGEEQISVDGLPATVVKSGEADGVDLAVLKVEGLWHKPPLKMKRVGEKGSAVMTLGFQQYDKTRLLRPLNGILGHQVELQSGQTGDRIQAWDLQIKDDHPLKPGYSGSPIIDQDSNHVLGVVSHLQGQGENGLAVSITALDCIWPIIDSKQLYQTLLKLGYRQQVRLFRKLIGIHSVAAFLIHGSPEYGQRWLLNRLVSQYLPNNFTGKVVKVDLARRVHRNDVNALWRELARRVGLNSKALPAEIIRCVANWWMTQNVLLIFHDVDCLPKKSFQELIYQFWLPLANQAREELKADNHYKLLMFLVDYQGLVGEWDTPFVEKLDSTWNAHPVRSPKIEEFSDDDLSEWIDNECANLPPEFKNEEIIIQEILNNSEEGIPELVLQEICDRCGCDWYEELEKWLKL
ncbi:MAG: trypsin-like peptidase domain-containing protein [Nostoc sp. CreGUA01]|nr:trypsin-like peptidase domain-containing protein [Nostoc sp. CreGUA01]